MHIVSYNLFEGAQGNIPLLQDFIRQQGIDAICFQETNGWQAGDPSQLEQTATETGLKDHVFGDSNTRFKLATLSRVPIIESHVYTEGFWHSAIRTTIQDDGEALDVWNIHLNPEDEDSRLAEAAKLIDMIDSEVPAILMGDFNSLSEHDQYPDNLAETLVAQGIRKFGNGRLRFDVTNFFVEHGLVDLAATLGTASTTVPTPANTDMFHATKMRLDYMFATKSVAQKVQEFETPKDALTDAISDHYPIVATLV